MRAFLTEVNIRPWLGLVKYPWPMMVGVNSYFDKKLIGRTVMQGGDLEPYIV
jgi:hypothetical protein